MKQRPHKAFLVLLKGAFQRFSECLLQHWSVLSIEYQDECRVVKIIAQKLKFLLFFKFQNPNRPKKYVPFHTLPSIMSLVASNHSALLIQIKQKTRLMVAAAPCTLCCYNWLQNIFKNRNTLVSSKV